MAKEKGSLGTVTPEANSIREGSDGCSMAC